METDAVLISYYLKIKNKKNYCKVFTCVNQRVQTGESNKVKRSWLKKT